MYLTVSDSKKYILYVSFEMVSQKIRQQIFRSQSF